MEAGTRIRLLDGEFAVCQVADFSDVDLDAPFCFTARTDDECSVVCLLDNLPGNTTAVERGFSAFKLEGTLDFALVGILARIAALLAGDGISIFAVSTYNTDYILVRSVRVEDAATIFRRNGYELV